jgi:RNA polymerase sigma factor (sigma-70 family)
MEWSEIYRRLSRDRNDPEAWRSLERAVRGWAQAALRQHGHDIIEDVVADTCATIAINFHRANGAATFRGFALGVFYNARRRARQTNSVLRQSLEGVDVPTPERDKGPDPDDLAALRTGLLALPERERKALMLRYFEEMSAAELGAELGVTEGNARRIVCNALARLRQHFEKHGRRGSRCEVVAVG